MSGLVIDDNFIEELFNTVDCFIDKKLTQVKNRNFTEIITSNPNEIKQKGYIMKS